MKLDTIVFEIGKADVGQIDILLDAVFARKRELYPEWDLNYIALPKCNWEERERIFENILRMEKKFRVENSKSKI